MHTIWFCGNYSIAFNYQRLDRSANYWHKSCQCDSSKIGLACFCRVVQRLIVEWNLLNACFGILYRPDAAAKAGSNRGLLRMKEISRLLAAMELLRKRVNKEMPSQHIALLLTVAQSPGITMPELVQALGMPQGTVSRNVKVLSNYVEHEKGVTRRKGRNLLRTQPDHENRQVLAVFLTGRGEALVEELARTLSPPAERERGYAEGRDPAGGRALVMH